MAQKLLLPVLPGERFYDAVVAVADVVAREGGTVTFLFTRARPPPFWEERDDEVDANDLDPTVEMQDAGDSLVERWQQRMIEGMADARDLMLERGVGEAQLSYLFADPDMPAAEAIAGEAAAGAFDMVVLARGAFVNVPAEAATPGGAPPAEIATAVQALADDGVKLLVT